MCKQELVEEMGLLGWSRSRLARAVYMATHDDDDPDGIARLEQSIKKEFQRSSTKQERFKRYLQILRADPEYRRLDRVCPRHFASATLDRRLLSGLEKMSKHISEQLLADDWSDAKED